MYVTEVTIVFLVYILAFVGAVIMLFLSVVLMLPSSVFTPKSQMLFMAILPASYLESINILSSFPLVLTVLYVIVVFLIARKLSRTYAFSFTKLTLTAL